MSSDADQVRHRFPVGKSVAVATALLLLCLFGLPYLAMGFAATRIAIESIAGGPTSADLALLPSRWRSDQNIRAYLVDDEIVFLATFGMMTKAAAHAKPGEGECFAAIGVIRGVPSDEAAAALASNWFAGAPAAITDETIGWIKRHRDNAWQSLARKSTDGRRIFWRQLAAAAFKHRPDAQLALLVNGLETGVSASEADWEGAADQPPK